MIDVLSSLTSPFVLGFALGFSLITAIGAQNVFIIQQGLIRRYVGPLVLFCASSDAVLIVAGVAGLAPLLAQLFGPIERWLFAGASIWLVIYGVIRAYAAWFGTTAIQLNSGKRRGLFETLAIAATLTFLNPHVYLDTVVLIGTVSLKFESNAKIAFALGAASASFVFFTGLGYGATIMSGVLQSPKAWRVTDAIISVAMFIFAFGMARAGGWL